MELVKNAAGETKLQKHTTEDRITAYFLGDITEADLGKKDKEILERTLNIWTLLNNYRTPQQAVDLHYQKYKHSEKEIALRTAWNDYRMATKLFGRVAESSEKARWILQYEYAMKTFQLAATRKDLTEMNRSIKNLIEINKNLKYGDGEDDRPSTYLLQINIKGSSGTKTINLDEYQKIPEKEISNLMSELDDTEITDAEIIEILEESDDAGEKD